jgi:transposase
MDLRMRVTRALSDGKQTFREVARRYDISLSSVCRYQKLCKKNVTPANKKRHYKKSRRKIQDLEAFREFVDKNNDLTLKELAEKYGGISYECVRLTLKKIGYSYKKNSTLCGAQQGRWQETSQLSKKARTD